MRKDVLLYRSMNTCSTDRRRTAYKKDLGASIGIWVGIIILVGLLGLMFK